MAVDPTNLNYWFPKLFAAGLPVPRTEIIEMTDDVMEQVWRVFDGPDSGDIAKYTEWLKMFEAKADAFGRPLFLRTGHTSHKHRWEKTCHVTTESDISSHVYDLIEFSECCGFPGLPWRTWVLRELLPVKPIGFCHNYGGMPVVREFRVFVDGAKVRCHHPYWPQQALIDGGLIFHPKRFEKWSAFKDDAELKHVLGLAASAGKAVGGKWSIDMLETTRGWFVTDMAEANKSFHWEGCANGR